MRSDFTFNDTIFRLYRTGVVILYQASSPWKTAWWHFRQCSIWDFVMCIIMWPEIPVGGSCKTSPSKWPLCKPAFICLLLFCFTHILVGFFVFVLLFFLLLLLLLFLKSVWIWLDFVWFFIFDFLLLGVIYGHDFLCTLIAVKYSVNTLKSRTWLGVFCI